ncbi:MAG TPA: zinc ribbon domain-containing protein [Methylomirabilota bacterium]|nr:zinc ribbon domain-containing protein [Methylomirabilota bacterium]
MVCSHCTRVVPDESAFCLGCGARLTAAERPAPVNGGGAHPAPETVSVRAGPPGSPGGRQAYTLSFRPIPDERVRYRVARWVCDHAPAHALAEVQSGLGRGDFVTFLALSPDEAETARQGIQALGVPPALVHLIPATFAEGLLLEPRRQESGKRITGRDWLTTLAVLGGLLGFGLLLVRLFGGRGF